MVKKANIAVFHTKMIIGGGERLLIDMAKALQDNGHSITIFVNEHDKNKCFEETVNGTVKVEEIPTCFPSTIFGRLSHICFIIKFLIIVFKVLMFSKQKFDCVIVDEHPFAIPLIKLFRKKVIYYMHYPVKLLGENQKGGSWIIFFILGLLEEFSLLFASKIFVNSIFIYNLYLNYFKFCGKLKRIPEVLYPIGNYTANPRPNYDGYKDLPLLKNKGFFLSVNRFCPNKNLTLAIDAFSLLKGKEIEDNILVLAGGLANEKKSLDHFEILKSYIKQKGLAEKVLFLINVNQNLLLFLYSKCICVLYTPVNEHFGIIPIEAQFYNCIVLAQNSGGPLETVGSKSGLLLPNNAEAWASKMSWLLNQDNVVQEMKKEGPIHVEKNFSFKLFTATWTKTINSLVNQRF